MAYKVKITGPIHTCNSSYGTGNANTTGFGGTANSSAVFTFQFSAWIKFNQLGVVIAQGSNSNHGWTLEINSAGYLKMTTKYNGNSSVGYSYHKFTTGVMYNLRMRSSNRAGASAANRLYYRYTSNGTAIDLPTTGALGSYFTTNGSASTNAATFSYTAYEVNQYTTIDPSGKCEFRGNLQLITTDVNGTARSVTFAINSLAIGSPIKQSLSSSSTVYFRSNKNAVNNCMAMLIDSQGNANWKCCYLIDSNGNCYERDKLSSRFKTIKSVD